MLISRRHGNIAELLLEKKSVVWETWERNKYNELKSKNLKNREQNKYNEIIKI